MSIFKKIIDKKQFFSAYLIIMKVIATYHNRMNAEEDRTYLMHKGIASIVRGGIVPRSMGEHFASEPAALAVQDYCYDTAYELLKIKYKPEPVPKAYVVHKIKTTP